MSWSLSRLGTYEKCAAKYKFSYIDKLPRGPTGAAAQRGLDKHALLEQFCKGELDRLPADLAYYDSFIRSMRESENMTLFPELKLAMNEKWEEVPYDSPDVWWRGILDLLVLHGGGAVVYDWKTGRVYDDHSQQRELYALALFSHYPELPEIRAVHVYLDQGQNREQTFHRSQSEQLQAGWVRRVDRMMTEKDFIPNPTYLCRYCNFSRFNGGPCRF